MKTNNKILFIVFSTALLLGYYQALRIDSPNYDLKLTRHLSIIDNSVEYPYKYRVLNPYIAQVWISALSILIPGKPAFILGYLIQNVLVFLFMFYSLFKFFRLWFDDTGAIVSLLLFAVLVPLSLTGYDVLGDLTTAGIMALGFYFINTKKEKLLYPLIIIAAFNELQLILLVAFYFFSKAPHFKDKKLWFNSFILAVTFFAAYAVIFLIRGGSAGAGDIQWYFTKDAAFNISHKDWIALWFIMLIPLVLFAFKGFKAKPAFLKNSALIVLPLFYFAAFFFIARLREIDKALTIFTILIPLALYSIIPGHIRRIQEDVNKSSNS